MTAPSSPDVTAATPELQSMPATAVPLRQKAVHGFAWVVLTVFANKIIGFLATLILARCLTKDDFGLQSIAVAASAFVLLLREAGVIQVLVQRGNNFDHWAGPGLGLVTTLSLFAGVLLAGLAHPIARAYAEPRLIPMLYVIAVCCPLTGLANVAIARLEHELRFDDIGKIVTGTTLVLYLTQMVLALAGVGAMSFVWGTLASTVVRLGWAWYLDRPATVGLFELSKWRSLLKDSAWLLGAGLFATIVSQYDRVILGQFASITQVGVYFFAFGLTTQTSQLLSTTLGGVLFPALSRLTDRPERQEEVFVELSRLLACVAVPLCTLQWVLAEPMLKLFGPQWDEAVPVFRVLGIGMAFVVCGGPSVALMQSQGRFRGLFIAQVIFTAFYFVFVTIAAAVFRTMIAVAFAVALYYFIFGPVGIQMVLRKWKFPWQESLTILAPGLIIAGGGMLAAGVAYEVQGKPWLPWLWPGVAYMAATAAISLTVYASEIRQILTLVRSLRKRGGAAA